MFIKQYWYLYLPAFILSIVFFGVTIHLQLNVGVTRNAVLSVFPVLPLIVVMFYTEDKELLTAFANGEYEK